MRVLITGMAGTGKSAVVKELRKRGYLAYDADDGYLEQSADGVWRWRVDAISTLLAAHEGELLFFAGCSDEQVEFTWDRKVLLTAPEQLILDRVSSRTNNPFGKSASDRQKILTDLHVFEPVIRRAADAVIDTAQPLSRVVDDVLTFGID